MADDDWQLEAVHEQFNVFDSITKPFETINSNDITGVYLEVKKTLKHWKMSGFEITTEREREITDELLKYGDKNEIKLSFVVVVTNINMNRNLCKKPIFVIISSGPNRYLDMNLTLFTSWEAFLANNDLPPCQYCFPVDGQYIVGGKLKVNFAPSPAVLKENEILSWKSIPSRFIASVASIAICASTFFFKIPPIILKNVEPLLKIAEDFVPNLTKYAVCTFEGVFLVQKIKNGGVTLLEGLYKLGQLLLRMNNDFLEDLGNVFIMVKTVMYRLYLFMKRNLSPFFERAPESSKHHFMAVTNRVDEEINVVESEAEEIIESSLKNNYNSEITRTAKNIHLKGESGSANKIFQNVEDKNAVNFTEKRKMESILNPKTTDILAISKNLAELQGQITLQDVKNNFEALSCVIKEEFIDKVKTYSRMLEAAKAGAGHAINIDQFNKSLGIQGDVKNYFWKEAVSYVLEPRLAYRVKEKKSSLVGGKNILILPICEQTNENPNSAYWLVGVDGCGKFSVKELIKALKTKFELNENHLAVKKDSTTIIIQSEDFTFVVRQELNSENTSEGFMLVFKNEV